MDREQRPKHFLLRISPLLHKFPRRTRKTGYGVDGDRRPSAVRLDDRQSPGSCCACAGTEARLSSLVKGARAGFEKPGEPWPHRLSTPSLQSSLCPTVLVTLRGGRYICREPAAAFYYCISNPHDPGSLSPNAFLAHALCPPPPPGTRQAFCATPRYATPIPASLDSKLVRFA